MYTTELNNKVYLFAKHTVSFDHKYGKYIFSDKWANEISKNYFDEKIQEIKQLFINQLRNGRNNEVVLNELLELTGNKVDWFSENNIHDIKFIDSLKLNNKSIYSVPVESKISPELFKDYNVQNHDEIEKKFLAHSDDVDYFEFLARHASNLNNYNNTLDFEKVQLIYCFQLYNDALMEIHNYIYQWSMDLPTTDISKIQFEDVYTISNSPKCYTSWSKLDLARLFYFLRDSGILYFDKSNPTKNNVQINKFIESNFKYYNSKTFKHQDIESINKEFSELSSPINRDKQIKFLNGLIKSIENQRDQIKI